MGTIREALCKVCGLDVSAQRTKLGLRAPARVSLGASWGGINERGEALKDSHQVWLCKGCAESWAITSQGLLLAIERPVAESDALRETRKALAEAQEKLRKLETFISAAHRTLSDGRGE